MKRARPTPGRWEPALYKVTPSMLKRLKVGSVQHAVCQSGDAGDPKGLLIAICGDEGGLDSQSAADARLIAMAPELLSVLTDLFHGCRIEMSPAMNDRIVEALRLANGTIIVLGGNAYRFDRNFLESAAINVDGSIDRNSWCEVEEIDADLKRTLLNYFRGPA